MIVLVQNSSNQDKIHRLLVDSNCTVKNFKFFLEIESQILVKDQALFFNDIELADDSMSLEDYGIMNESVVQLLQIVEK